MSTSDLMLVEQASQLLEKATTVDEVKDIRNKASALQSYFRQQKAALSSQNYAAELKLRAERKLGELTREMPKANPGPRPEISPATGPISKREQIADIGMDKQRVSEFEKVAALPEDQFEAYIEFAKSDGRELTTAGALRLASGGRLAAFSSESVEWYTPQPYIEAAREALGGIDLDPASSAKANEMVKAKRLYTVDDDGLSKHWNGTVWLNPPYGQEDGTGTWVEKMITEYQEGHMEAGILLVNAVTDRKWFQPLWDYAICFTDHRIEFYTPNGQPRSPVSGNAFVYLGKAVKGFANAFEAFGSTVRRV